MTTFGMRKPLDATYEEALQRFPGGANPGIGRR
jgi:hypothetical protein